jgi:hypothetical protein
VSSGGPEQTLVEKEFLNDKHRESWLTVNSGLQFTESLAVVFAFAAR